MGYRKVGYFEQLLYILQWKIKQLFKRRQIYMNEKDYQILQKILKDFDGTIVLYIS